MPLGDDEDMRGRLRINVFESEGLLIFINFLAGYFALNDPAEQAVAHGSFTLSLQRRRIKLEMIIEKHSVISQNEHSAISTQHSASEAAFST